MGLPSCDNSGTGHTGPKVPKAGNSVSSDGAATSLARPVSHRRAEISH